MVFTDQSGRKAVVLLAEDNEPDRRTVERGFVKARLAVRLLMVEDGEACLDYLFKQGRYADCQDCPRPDLLLLDLNMPKLDGLEVLRRIRADGELRSLPVVMLTTSDDEPVVVDAYARGVNAFITKPVDPGRFLDVVRKLGEFWFELVVTPSGLVEGEAR